MQKGRGETLWFSRCETAYSKYSGQGRSANDLDPAYPETQKPCHHRTLSTRRLSDLRAAVDVLSRNKKPSSEPAARETAKENKNRDNNSSTILLFLGVPKGI